ncbi:unnamed protein product [Prorocentrum cordatum]|uniref:Uncharacterized protein n=1 Tax=Prorocentrum cordatum TaxID=2364126 RepID=A0ABN9XA58_9DINO|nr:unnamed protein product [Polarella glacialis]
MHWCNHRRRFPRQRRAMKPHLRGPQPSRVRACKTTRARPPSTPGPPGSATGRAGRLPSTCARPGMRDRVELPEGVSMATVAPHRDRNAVRRESFVRRASVKAKPAKKGVGSREGRGDTVPATHAPASCRAAAMLPRRGTGTSLPHAHAGPRRVGGSNCTDWCSSPSRRWGRRREAGGGRERRRTGRTGTGGAPQHKKKTLGRHVRPRAPAWRHHAEEGQ